VTVELFDCRDSDDVVAAIRKLKVLGSGFTLIPIGSRYLVQSVPGELTMDHASVLQQAEVSMKAHSSWPCWNYFEHCFLSFCALMLFLTDTCLCLW